MALPSWSLATRNEEGGRKRLAARPGGRVSPRSFPPQGGLDRSATDSSRAALHGSLQDVDALDLAEDRVAVDEVLTVRSWRILRYHAPLSLGWVRQTRSATSKTSETNSRASVQASESRQGMVSPESQAEDGS